MHSTKKRIVHALWVALALQSAPQVPRAQVAADPGAAAARRPVVQALGSLPVVNIAVPNAAGVSHNLYSNFNVSAQGVVLNNAVGATTVAAPVPPPATTAPSPAPVTPRPPPCQPRCFSAESVPVGGARNAPATTAGLLTDGLVPKTGSDSKQQTTAATTSVSIGANPFLGGRPARLVVNEVTGAASTSLLGPLIVAGPGADVVIANPFGLVCDGCSFNNAPRVSLASGRPVWAGNGLDSLLVTGGSVAVGAGGLTGDGLAAVDLIGGRVSVSGGINLTTASSAVSVLAGPNQVAYATLAASPVSRSDARPAQAVEVSSAGGMYAQQIFIVSSEQGAGVNLAGTLRAGSGGLTVDAAGNLQLAGSIQSGGAAVLSGTQARASQLRLAADGLTVLQTGGPLALDGGDLQAADLLVSSGGDLQATGTRLSAKGDLRLSASGDATLTAAALSAGAQASLQAAGELSLLPSATTTRELIGTTTRTSTRYTRTDVKAGTDLTAQARNGLLTLDGAQLEAGGALSLQGAGVALLARKDSTTDTTQSSTTTTRPSTETPVGTRLQAGGDITVLATGTSGDLGNVLATGAVVESRDGQVSMLAARNLELTNDITTDRFYERFYQVRRGLFSRKVTEHIKSTVDETVQPGMVEGRGVSLAAGGQLDIVASSIMADGAVGLHADGDLNLLSKDEHHYAYESRTVKKSGLFSNGGLSITLGSQSKTTISQQESALQHGSSVGSLAGDILATAGGQYLQLSSDLTAPQGDVSISAANVAMRSAPNTTSVLNIVRQRQSGVTLSASHPVIDSLQTAAQMASVARRTDSGRYQAMAVLTSALSIYNAFTDPTKLALPTGTSGAALNGWTFNLSVGSSSSSFESLQQTSTPVGPAITTGRHLAVTATGTGPDQGDITLVGARLSAGGDATLRAARDITLAAAIGSSSDTSKSRSSSGAVGVSVGPSGASLTVAANRSNGWTNGWGTTYYNSEVGAAGRLAMDSGANTTLQGAKASGQSVAMRVGSAAAGSLTVSSPQDEDHFIARESSSGFNFSVPLPGSVPTYVPWLSLTINPSFSFGVNRGAMNLLADVEAVREQTAINAGTGGFDITVNGHTHLKGGAITTEGAAAASRLVTQSLSHETLLNRDVAQGRSWAVSVSLSDQTKDASGKEKGALAGSAVGYARLDTDQRSHTASAVVGTVSVTRPDLHAQAVATVRAAERQPLVAKLADVQSRLGVLLASEPPRDPAPCSDCWNPGGASTGPASINMAKGGPSAVLAGKPSGATLQSEKPNDTAAWTAWNTAVQQLYAEQARLQQRIAAVDTKAYQTTASLATTASALHQPLLHTFDRSKATQELKDGVAVTAAFGKAAFKLAGDVAKAQARAARDACDPTKSCDAAKDWEDGGKLKTILHGIVGAVSGGRAGALANMTAEAATPFLRSAILAAGVAENSVTYNALMAAAKSAVGGGLNGMAGAAVAFNADANNRQLHRIEIQLIQDYAARFAQQLNGGREPNSSQIAAAEMRLANEAYRLVQVGVSPASDAVAQAFLRHLPNVQLPGDPNFPEQNVGFSFYAPIDQRSNTQIYMDGLVTDPEVLSFYFRNSLKIPSPSQIIAASNKVLAGSQRVEALTLAATLFAGGLALAPATPSALTACLANLTSCGIAASEFVAGTALGPNGMQIGNLARQAGVRRVLSGAEANAEWIALRPGNTPTWADGIAVLEGVSKPGTRMRMYVDAVQEVRLREGDMSALGGFATFNAPVRSEFEARSQAAITQAFKPESRGPLYLVELEVTRPMNIQIGVAGPQMPRGAYYPGGATQILFKDYTARVESLRIVSPPVRIGK